VTIHVTGYRTAIGGEGKPRATPNEIMSSDFETLGEAASYIRSFNRMMAKGETFLFSMTGNGSQESESHAEAPSEGGSAAPDSRIVAVSIVDYALNQMGAQITELLQDKWLSSSLEDSDYDDLVVAQNKIVSVMRRLEGADESPDAGNGSEEAAA